MSRLRDLLHCNIPHKLQDVISCRYSLSNLSSIVSCDAILTDLRLSQSPPKVLPLFSEARLLKSLGNILTNQTLSLKVIPKVIYSIGTLQAAFSRHFEKLIV